MNVNIDINGIKLETERLILCSWEIRDLDDFFEYASVDGVGERAGWIHHKNRKETLEILKMFIEQNKTFSVVLKDNFKVIGSIGIEECRKDLDESLKKLKGREIGCVLNKNYWSKGLMTEAIEAVIEYCFETLRLDFLTASYFNYNIASKRLQEKLGFKFYKNIMVETRYGTEENSTLMLLKNN